MKKFLLFSAIAAIMVSGCINKKTEVEKEHGNAAAVIDQKTINELIDAMAQGHEAQRQRIERGVNQTAMLWREEDGSSDDFKAFCQKAFIYDDTELEKMFNSVSMHYETILGHFNKISLDLKRPVHLEGYNTTAIDEIFAGYDPYANIQNDFYRNRIAFHIALNFPHYTLAEKEEMGEKWTRKEWAYARMGDMFTSRIPADLLQKFSVVMANADNYISNYNIYMGNLLDDNGKTSFPADLKLISHWNLRDELKSHYDGTEEGLKKQRMVYDVMQRIIKQEIPETIINSNKYQWNPTTNKVYESGNEIASSPEPNTRYQHLLNSFNANVEIDKYRPGVGNYINAKFDEELEIPQAKVEKMFVDYISSPQIKAVAEIIKKRLGRNLEPFDIWYDGFKTRSTLNQEELSRKTAALYPNPAALEKDIPNILIKLGFKKDKALEIASHIAVDPSKGAGHAWGADMKGEKAHLRTRISGNGMDYKGYNIAIHELGHNVEQTLSLYDVDYWVLRGVPNTAFTEAWAFTFQHRDLQLLGIKSNNPDKEALDVLDNCWATYEIMGVSLVDQRVWQWMYDNPDCNAEGLKNAAVKIAIDVWNEYYAPVFGVKDSPILAIYSHMIDYPLYLSAYPIGHLIEFQMSEYMADKNLGDEMQRICTQGKLIPELWMKKAVGEELSAKPLLHKAQFAIDHINKKQ